MISIVNQNVIFTICAKNYLAHAFTLGNSVKKYCENCDFYILLSDEWNSSEKENNTFIIVEVKELGLPDFDDLTFKYDVIEFSTAIKPFFINRLFASGYDKVLYLDPDMRLYRNVDFVFELLNGYDALLTPHILKPYIKYEGATPEEDLLFVGTFNLGFFAVRNTTVGRHIIMWWKEKLKNQCFADKENALHVDQKWMDFLPSLYGETVLILRDPSVNVAFWNYHERSIVNQNGVYLVNETIPLTIFHFSSFDPSNVNQMAKRQRRYTLDSMPSFAPLFLDYLNELKINGLGVYSDLNYKYDVFDNGIPILKFHRRLYRGLMDEGYKFKSVFGVEDGSYYDLLMKNRIMLIDKEGRYKVLKKTFGENPPVFKRVFFLLRGVKRLFGIRYYYLMMRFFAIFHRFENNTFLIKNRR